MPMERLLKEAAQKIKVRLVELLHKSLNEENHNTLGSVLQVCKLFGTCLIDLIPCCMVLNGLLIAVPCSS